MILAEPNRFCALTLKPGDIVINEDRQKFKVLISSAKVVRLEVYTGNKNPIQFVYLGELPKEV